MFYLRGDNTQGVAVLIAKQLLADPVQQRNDALPLFWRHQKSLAGGIGEEMIISDATAKFGVAQQFGIEEQRPPLCVYFLARVGLSSNLARATHISA